MVAVHLSEFGTNGTFVVLDALLLAADLAFAGFTDLRDPKGEVGGLDGQIRLDHPTLGAGGKSRRGIERCATRARPEAKANVAENSRNGAVLLRVNTEVHDDDAGDHDAELLGQPSRKRRTIVAEEDELRGVDRHADAETEVVRTRGGRERLGAFVAGLCGGRVHEGFPFGRPKVACAPSPRLHEDGVKARRLICAAKKCGAQRSSLDAARSEVDHSKQATPA